MKFDKGHPFLATIKERYPLCRAGSQKNTQHVVLDLSGSGLHYKVGDSFGVYPLNDPVLVEHTLKAMKAKGDELITSPSSETISVRNFLTSKATITRISVKVLREIAKRQTNSLKKDLLDNLLNQSPLLKEFLTNHELWDLLEEHTEVTFEPQELCQLLGPLAPRYFSAASSMRAVGEEVHLTVELVEYVTNQHLRKGVCTHYLCNMSSLNQPIIPVFVQPNEQGFTLPNDPNASIIMIGPGTGIAPFRGFMQERKFRHDSGKNWIFFGDWNRSLNYYYEDDLLKLENEGFIKLDTAFSRDQDYKIYVQHKISEHGAEFFDWLQNGAYIFVSGDAQHMAKDVDAMIHRIVQQFGNLNEVEAKNYVKALRTSKHYVCDVY